MLDLNRDEWSYVLDMYRMLRTGLRTEPGFPTLIEVQTVNRCNARCPVCPYPYTIGQQPLHTMSDEMFDGILEECAAAPNFRVMVLAFQNEPFVDRRLLEKARRFKQRMPDRWLEVVTNGSPLTPAMLPEVFEHFDLLSLSVNAHSAEVYETVMEGLRWQKMQELLGHLSARREWRDKTILRFIKQKQNYREQAEFKRHWNRAGFRVFGYDINDRVGDLKNFDELQIPMTLSRRARLGVLRLASRALSSTCPIPFVSSYVRANGDVVLCFNDYTDHRLLGNISQSSIREVFDGPAYRQIRASARAGRLGDNEPCKHCKLFAEGIWLTV